MSTNNNNTSRFLLFMIGGFIVMSGIVFGGLYAETYVVPHLLGKGDVEAQMQVPRAKTQPVTFEEVPTTIETPNGDNAMTVRDGLIAWYSAENFSIENGKRAPYFADASKKGNHARQPLPISRPTLIKDGINGKPVLRFDGFDDCMFIESMRYLTPVTIYAVWAKPSPGGVPYQRLYSSGSRGADYQAGGVYYIPASDGNGVAPAPPQLHKKIIPTQVDISIFCLGRLNAGITQFFSGDLAEMLIYTKPLSIEDQRKVEQYLQQKYKLIGVVLG
jgi:hypothetical protein